MKRVLMLLLALLLLAPSALAEEREPEPFADFTLQDQYGRSHSLADYAGKVMFINYWTTWCYWCKTEMNDIEAIYHELGENQKDVAVLGVASPVMENGVDAEGIAAFLTENSLTYPVLIDPDGALFAAYGISSFPTTLLVLPDGRLLGGVAGAMSKEEMLSVIALGLEK